IFYCVFPVSIDSLPPMPSYVYFVLLRWAHRYLHSFPTRRSSDLPCAVRGVLPGALGVRRSRRRGTDAARARGRGGHGPGDRHRRSEEHTSNSSHVSTSYAVFCLKKKRRDKNQIATHQAVAT